MTAKSCVNIDWIVVLTSWDKNKTVLLYVVQSTRPPFGSQWPGLLTPLGWFDGPSHITTQVYYYNICKYIYIYTYDMSTYDNLETYTRIWTHKHYSDVIMSAIVSLITSLTIVYSTVYSDADQRKLQSSKGHILWVIILMIYLCHGWGMCHLW